MIFYIMSRICSIDPILAISVGKQNHNHSDTSTAATFEQGFSFSYWAHWLYLYSTIPLYLALVISYTSKQNVSCSEEENWLNIKLMFRFYFLKFVKESLLAVLHFKIRLKKFIKKINNE